jgi:predicted phage terminase large subunit-like protein
LIRRNLRPWCVEALSVQGQTPSIHHDILIRELEAIASGANDRLMVLMPPGSAKSTYASVLFPAWWFTRHPQSAIISASHTAELAERFGRRVRNLVAVHGDTLGYRLAADNKSAGRWETNTGGEYFAAGVGGAITGRRADLAVIDDPVKSREEAESETVRERTWDWYRSDLYTRLKPGARIVLIMTRWHEDDLGGRLLSEMEAGGDRWRVLKLPALADSADDPLGRAIGDPIWPEWEDADALARKRAAIGERDWAALYQQNPRPLEGSIFKVALLGTADAEPMRCKAVRAWDLAATAATGGRDPDWTVGVKMLRGSDGALFVADVVRLRGPPEEVEATIVATATRDGRGVEISLPQDPGQAGVQQVKYLTRKLQGYTVHSSTETGDKATRAMPAASQVNVGNVRLIRGDWNRSFIDELAGFPGAAKDDQVDALSRAFSRLIGPAVRNITDDYLSRI